MSEEITDLEAFVSSIAQRLIALNFCGGSVTESRMTPSQDEQLPTADVFVSGDEASPAGDARAGVPHFIHRTQLTVQVTDQGNTGKALKAKLETHARIVMGVVLKDPTLRVTLEQQLGLEGIGRVSRVYDQPPEGRQMTARVQVQFELLHRSRWDPDTDALPDLETVSVIVPVAAGDEPPLRLPIAVPTD